MISAGSKHLTPSCFWHLTHPLQTFSITANTPLHTCLYPKKLHKGKHRATVYSVMPHCAQSDGGPGSAHVSQAVERIAAILPYWQTTRVSTGTREARLSNGPWGLSPSLVPATAFSEEPTYQFYKSAPTQATKTHTHTHILIENYRYVTLLRNQTSIKISKKKGSGVIPESPSGTPQNEM